MLDLLVEDWFGDAQSQVFLNLWVPCCSTEDTMLKLRPSISWRQKLDYPALCTKNSQKIEPKCRLLCVQDFFKILLWESIKCCVFKHAQAFIVPCLLKRYVRSQLHNPKQCTRSANWNFLAQNFLCIEGVSVISAVLCVHSIFLDRRTTTRCNREAPLIEDGCCARGSLRQALKNAIEIITVWINLNYSSSAFRFLDRFQAASRLSIALPETWAL